MKIIVCSVLFFLSAGFVQAQKVEKKLTFKERFEALLKEHTEEQDKYLNPPVQPKTAAEVQKYRDDLKKVMDNYFDKFLALAKSDPKADLAFKCAAQAYGLGNNSRQMEVFDFWIEHCADNPEVILYFQHNARYDRSGDYCRRLAERTKTRSVKGMALYAPAEAIIENYEGWFNGFDKKDKKPISPAERLKLVDDAAKQIHAVLKEYGDEKFRDINRKETTIAQAAKKTLHLAEHLALGRTAPDFEAESLTDGKKQKLCDYRGKIVVLDLYYYFGGYTHDRGTVIPNLRRMAARLKDQPVQIISVNLDDKKDSTASLFQREKNLPWPQLWDGSKTGVAELYQVPSQTQSTPYVVDAKGVIRGKRKWGEDLDALVTDLLKDSGLLSTADAPKADPRKDTGADAPKDDAVKKELLKFQGTWTIVSFSESGAAVDELKGKKITCKDNQLIQLIGKDEETLTFQLDPSKKPKQITCLPPDAEQGDPMQPGIYEFDGDTLKICLASYAVTEKTDPKTMKQIGRKVMVGERPTGFDDKKAMLMILKRHKK